MRRFAWNAARARKHCQNRRSLVNPNDGFWRSLCAFEQVLGITDRSAGFMTLVMFEFCGRHVSIVVECLSLMKLMAQQSYPS